MFFRTVFLKTHKKVINRQKLLDYLNNSSFPYSENAEEDANFCRSMRKLHIGHSHPAALLYHNLFLQQSRSNLITVLMTPTKL